MRVGLLVIAGCVMGCSPIKPGQAVAIPERPPIERGVDGILDEDAIDARVTAFLDDAGPVGLAIAVIADGQVQYTAGYGWADIEARRPMDADTPILLSSVSKTFVGVVAQQAVERTGLNLDDRADSVLGFAIDNPKIDNDAISFRHLLTHHGGIEDSPAYGQAYANGDPTIELGTFCAEYLTEGGDHWRAGNFAKRAPGEGFSYSNVGMSVAALALGAREDQSFANLLQRDVLDPLGMSHSRYYLSELPVLPAVPYAFRGGKAKPYPQYGYPTYPDGMLRSSANDMGKYAAAMTAGGTLDGVEILSEAGVDAMFTVDPDLGTDEMGQAIAWARRSYDGHELRGHNGGDFGSATELWVDRERGVALVTMFNSGPGSYGAWIDLQKDLLDLAAAQ